MIKHPLLDPENVRSLITHRIISGNYISLFKYRWGRDPMTNLYDPDIKQHLRDLLNHNPEKVKIDSLIPDVTYLLEKYGDFRIEVLFSYHVVCPDYERAYDEAYFRYINYPSWPASPNPEDYKDSATEETVEYTASILLPIKVVIKRTTIALLVLVSALVLIGYMISAVSRNTGFFL